MQFLSTLICVLLTATSGTAQSGNFSQHCHTIKSELTEYIYDSFNEYVRIERLKNVIELTTGVDVYYDESVLPYICPLIESTSLSELQTQIVQTGTLGKVSSLAYRMFVVEYGVYKEYSHIYPYMSSDEREYQQKISELYTFLENYGYMDFDQIALAMSYGAAVGLGISGPLQEPPIYPGNSTADDASLREMFWNKVRQMLRSAKKVFGTAWPTMKQYMNQYSAGTINLNDGTNMRALTDGLADCRSEADVGNYMASNFLGPLLNQYFPLLEGALNDQRRRTEEFEQYVLTLDYYTEEEKQEKIRPCQSYYELHDALRNSGFLSIA